MLQISDYNIFLYHLHPLELCLKSPKLITRLNTHIAISNRTDRSIIPDNMPEFLPSSFIPSLGGKVYNYKDGKTSLSQNTVAQSTSELCMFHLASSSLSFSLFLQLLHRRWASWEHTHTRRHKGKRRNAKHTHLCTHGTSWRSIPFPFLHLQQHIIFAYFFKFCVKAHNLLKEN